MTTFRNVKNIVNEPSLRYQVQTKYAKDLPTHPNRWGIVWSFLDVTSAIECANEYDPAWELARVVCTETDEVVYATVVMQEAA